MTLSFRSARAEDEPGVQDLLDQEGFDLAFDPREFEVIIEMGRVVGCVRMVRLPSGEYALSKLAVAKPFRHRGLATLLMERTLARVRGKFVVTVGPDQARFFERLGFVQGPAGSSVMTWESPPK